MGETLFKMATLITFLTWTLYVTELRTRTRPKWNELVFTH